MSNIYYSPEDHGLEVLASLDISEPDYSFDLLVVWKDADSRLYYAEDSGCSCPCPFEDFDRQTITPAQGLDEIISRLEYRIRDDYLYERDTVRAENRLLDLKHELRTAVAA